MNHDIKTARYFLGRDPFALPLADVRTVHRLVRRGVLHLAHGTLQWTAQAKAVIA